MLRRFFKNINRTEATKFILAESKNVGFIIRQSSDQSVSNVNFIIYPDNMNNTVRQYLACTYITPEGNVDHFKFINYESDPFKMTEKFFQMIKDCPDLESIKQAMLALSPKKVKSPTCIFVNMHRNAHFTPKEKTEAKAILESKGKGVLIISTQKPVQGLDDEKISAKAGRTGIEIQKILENNQFKDKWVIITGHGARGTTSVSGAYFFVNNDMMTTTVDVDFTAEQYADLLIEGGLEKNSVIKILLYVCYGGARKENDKGTIPMTSYAEQLADALAKKGITSYIVASKTPVKRFTGEYQAGEEKGKSLNFRVTGTDAIREVVGIPNDTNGIKGSGIYMSKDNQDTFVISTQGIGFAKNLEKDLTLGKKLSS